MLDKTQLLEFHAVAQRSSDCLMIAVQRRETRASN